MGFDPTDAIQIGIGITAFFATITAIFLFMNAWNERLARLLGYIMTWFAVWSWLGFTYHLTDNLDLARDIRILSIIAQTIAQAISIQYLFAFLSEKRALFQSEKIWYWGLQAGNGVLMAMLALDFLMGTHLIVGIVGAEGAARLTPEPGSLFILFPIYFYSMVAAIAWFMTKGILLEHGKVRRGNIILTISIVGGYALGGIGIFTWYGITGNFSILRGFGIPLFVVAAFYTITSYRLFNMRVAAAEVFVFGLWGAIFWRTLLNDTFAQAIPDILLLIATIALGLVLIRSVTQELAVRIKLENVSDQLRVLNSSLETEVEKRTHELARSKKHTESVVEHLPVGLVEILEDTTIVRCNEAAGTILAIDHVRSLGSPALIHPALLQVLGENIVPGIREVAIETSGKKRDIEATISPLVLEEGSGHVIILRDVTERRALERAKNDFVATAAHQLRTPLSAIKWTFDLLSSESLSKTQKDILVRGAAGVKNMMNIAEGLMMSIRTAEGVSKYTFKETPFKDVLTKALTLVTPLAEKEKVTLTNEIPEMLPSSSVDLDNLVSATQNLLDNAIKYTPEGGTVVLRASATDTDITVSVTDTGIGISKEDQGHLFEKFFRAHDAVELSTDGSGLGLSIVKSIVEAHGGSLKVESEEDSGSTFSYTLPIRRAT